MQRLIVLWCKGIKVFSYIHIPHKFSQLKNRIINNTAHLISFFFLPGTLCRNSCWYFPMIRKPSSSSTKWTGQSKLKFIQSLSGPTTSIMLPHSPTTAPAPHLQSNQQQNLVKQNTEFLGIYVDTLFPSPGISTCWIDMTYLRVFLVKK